MDPYASKKIITEFQPSCTDVCEFTNPMLVPVDVDGNIICKCSSLTGFCFGLEVFFRVSGGKKKKVPPS